MKQINYEHSNNSTINYRNKKVSKVLCMIVPQAPKKCWVQDEYDNENDECPRECEHYLECNEPDFEDEYWINGPALVYIHGNALIQSNDKVEIRK